jgi:uncharacterized repeat protein (TIGR01451 family)
LSLALLLAALTLLGMTSAGRAAPLFAPTLPDIEVQGQVSPPGEVVYGELLTLTLRYRIPAGEVCEQGRLQLHFDGPSYSYLLVNYVGSIGPLPDSGIAPPVASVVPTVTNPMTDTASAWVDWGLGTIDNSGGGTIDLAAYKILLLVRVPSDSQTSSNRRIQYEFSGNSHHLRCSGQWYTLYPSPPGVNLNQPDLSLSKNADPSSGDLSPDQLITYTLTLENEADASTAYDVVLSDVLPLGTTFVGSVTGTLPNVDNNVLTWTVGTLTPGQNVLYSFEARLPVTGNVLHDAFVNETQAFAWSISKTIPGARLYQPTDSYDHDIINAEVAKENATAWNYPGEQGSTTGNAFHEAVAGEGVTITVYFTIPQGTIAYSVSPRVLLEDGLDPDDGAPLWDNIELDQGSIDPQRRSGKNFTQLNYTEISNIDASAGDQVLSYVIYAHPHQSRYVVGSDELNDGNRLLTQPILRWCDDPGCTVEQSSNQYYAESETDNSTVSVVFVRPDVEPEISHTYQDAAGIGQGGGQVRFDIVNTNQRSRPNAYDMVSTAILEPGLTFVEATPLADDWVVSNGRTYITWTVPVTLAADESWSAAITATLPTTFVIGSTFTVTADLHHETFPGSVTDEGIYVNSASYTILPGMNHFKNALPDENVTIGDTVVYTVVTSLGQGTVLYSLSYTDTLPPGSHYVHGTFDLQNATLLPSYPIVVDNTALSGQEDLVWRVEDINLLGASDPLVVTATYQAELSGLDTEGEPVHASSESDIRYQRNADNRAVAYWLTIQGVPTSTAALDAAVHQVRVAQPFMRNTYFDTARTDGPFGDEEVGGSVSFEITFRNSTQGDVPAYDVHVCDELPPGLAFDSLYSFSDPSGCDASFVSQPSPGDEETICWILDEVCKSTTDFSLEYIATVLPSATPGLLLTNDARINDYSAQPGGINDGDLDDEDLPAGVNFDRNYMDFPEIALPDSVQCSDTGQGECPFTVLGLEATKTAQQATVGPGHTITYVIEYENTSALRNYSDIVISDTYDSQLTYLQATPAPASHDPGQRLLVWNVASLAQGQSGQITLDMRVSSAISGIGAVTNSIKWSGWDGAQTVTPGPIVTTTPVDAANLHVQLSGPDTTYAGESIVYTVVYSNDGTVEASPVTIDMDYGGYLNFDSATLQGSPISPEGGTDNVFVDPTALPADGSPRTLVLQLTVKSPLPYALDQIESSASVSSPTSLPVADDITVTLKRPTFDFDKTGPALAPDVGGLIQYRFQLVNTGNLTATNCVITDTWDANTSFNTGSIGWTDHGTYATYAIASLNPDAVATVNDLFVNVAGEQDRYTNQAALGCDQTTAIQIAEQTWAASIATDKVASADPAFPGRTLTYTIYYTNTGGAVVNATIADTLPDGFSYQGPAVGPVTGEGCLDPGWQFQGLTGQEATWTCATLLAGAEGQLQICGTVTADPADEGTWLVNEVLSSGDDIPDRPMEPALRTRIARPWLGIAKSDNDNSPVAPGNTFTYTLVYSNYGTAPAYDVSISDQLPDQVTFVGCDPGCTHDSGLVTWDASSAPVLSTVPTDTLASVDLAVQVNAGTEGQTIANDDYTIQSHLLEPILGPAVETSILAPHLDLVKTATPDVISAVGTSITYTINYANDGGGLLTNIVITDELSTSVGFRSASAQCEHSGGLVGGVVTCDIGELGQEQSGIVEILVESTAAQDIDNLAQGDSDQTAPTSSYTATVWYDTDGCYEVRIASFSYDSPVNAGQSETFMASYLPALAHTPISYTWDFGSGPQWTDVPTITHIFDSPGTYPVTLDVDNACVQEAVQFQDNVEVSGQVSDFYVYLPLILRLDQ